MRPDAEGFLYPVLTGSGCIECGACEAVCPALHADAESGVSGEPEVWAVRSRNEQERERSSSGGVFSLLARRVLASGGAVFGVRLDENMEAVHDCCESVDRLDAFRGSKYMQSRVGDAFSAAGELLRGGREVLFTGTPCQVRGLLGYLERRRIGREHLLAVDVVCHGAPSPAVWRRYLDWRFGGRYVTAACFRDKASGWKRYSLSVTADGRTFTRRASRDPFMSGFLQNLYLRPSCYQCGGEMRLSGSDLTLGDLWGAEKIAPELDDDRGTSLAIVRSQRGGEALRAVSAEAGMRRIAYADALRCNPSIERAVGRNSRREDFFAAFGKHSFISALAPCVHARVLRKMRWHLLR